MIGDVSDPVKTVCAWWDDLRDNRAARAKLRRAGGLMAAALEPATLYLARRLRAKPDELENVAFISAVLADVREDNPGFSVARALGSPEDRPLCSILRLQRIVEASKGEAQLTAFRRALALLGHKANVRDLAQSLLEWNDSACRDRRRQQWLYDYYHTDNPAKGQIQETTP